MMDYEKMNTQKLLKDTNKLAWKQLLIFTAIKIQELCLFKDEMKRTAIKVETLSDAKAINLCTL